MCRTDNTTVHAHTFLHSAVPVYWLKFESVVTNASVMAEQRTDKSLPNDTGKAENEEVKTNGAPQSPKKDKKDATLQEFKLGDLVWWV